MNSDRLRIALIDENSEFLETVIGWIVTEWHGSETEVRRMLVDNRECPPALIAVCDNEPIAVLAYKLHPLAQSDSEELWINALYVVSSWRAP